MEVQALKRHYSRLADESLQALVAEGISDLVPEALPVLRAELTNRGFFDLAEAVELQMRGPEPGEIDAVVTWLRSSACPMCGHRGTALNACQLDTGYDSQFLLGCPSCLDAAVKKAAGRNAVGCLFAPLGLIFGIRGAVRNREAVKVVSSSEPSDALIEYVRRHHAILSVSMRAIEAQHEQ